jgi:hypothetical protein
MANTKDARQSRAVFSSGKPMHAKKKISHALKEQNVQWKPLLDANMEIYSKYIF